MATKGLLLCLLCISLLLSPSMSYRSCRSSRSRSSHSSSREREHLRVQQKLQRSGLFMCDDNDKPKENKAKKSTWFDRGIDDFVGAYSSIVT